VRAAITPRTRLLMLNFPHNPTGRTLRTEDLTALEEIVTHHGILLISDEVYEHIVFDDRPHLSLMRSSALAERTVVVSSFGKTFHTTGWKVGYDDGAARTDSGDPQGPPVHGVCGQHAGAACVCRLPADPGALPRAAGVLPGEARPADRGLRSTPFRVLPCEGRTSCSRIIPRSVQRRNPNSRRR
jgi:hypothetical protein